MSELLLRGYNVAVPSVDVGDDVLVLDDQRGSLRRVQVKTADVGEELRDEHARLTRKVVRDTLSRQQLREQKASDLFFMLMVRWNRRWRFLFVPRQKLADVRDDFVARDRTNTPGPKPKPDELAVGDTLLLEVTWTEDDAVGWAVSLRDYLETWTDLPELPWGPGAVSPASAP
jgi:hypothetical protein